MKNNINIIISGGDTGGHVFPAISIANELRNNQGVDNILFVGANGRLEMEKVPAAGFPIKGLPVIGLSRKLSYKLIVFVIYLVVSLIYILNKSLGDNLSHLSVDLENN